MTNLSKLVIWNCLTKSKLQMSTTYHYSHFPPINLNWKKLIPLIGPTSAAIAHYDGLLKVIPNPEILLSSLETREAVLSSRLEGTQATVDEVLEYEATGGVGNYSDYQKADFQEIVNYQKAINEAKHLLKKLPLSQRVIKEIHKILLAGVRGQNKSPGEYRRVPNWIGSPGCTMETATYIPISVDKLLIGMDAWEKFIHADFFDTLVQLALLHVEFEALHPFLDGNGRLGRILIPLFMWQKGIISQPVFYASSVFENDRENYYSYLLAVSRDGAWTEWCQFFLETMQKQAYDNNNKAKSIIDLHVKMKKKIPNLVRSQYTIQALDWIFRSPIFSPHQFFQGTKIPEPTARRIISSLVDNNILNLIIQARGQRAAIYRFSELLQIVNK